MEQSMWADVPAEEPKRKKTAPLPPADSTLSAAATTFAPHAADPPPPHVATLDTFAQTVPPQEDLFDDAVPEESMRIRSDDDLFSDDFTPAPEPTVVRSAPQTAPEVAPQPARTTGEAPPIRARGRGRGRGRGTYDERNQNRGNNHAQTRALHSAPHNGSPKPAEAASQVPAQASTQTQKSAPPPENAPTTPRKDGPTSVRGDRHATGGVRKPKLSEDELAEKMAKISLKNADLTAAHARAEADAASFEHREQQAKHVAEQRKKEERRDRQQMMGEREKNRARKLKALGNREWDSEKQEDDFRGGGRHDKKGGFAGDKGDYSDGREYLLREPRGGGRGQAGIRAANQGGAEGRLEVPKADDFPSLPPVAKSEAMPEKMAEAEVFSDSAKPSGKSWADQVEAS
ncbi:hypothetical protein TI39_contig4216g00008 [Zymoseptoria brevis]|uniref:Uncharacterized protein n=1 Tax=Zymoseptoria brevis TaxID=1047168 RepID=A0A0F4GAS3_9PEZI|nr:hypothetical protein TI39_contig4216g00008 [Zymoseptoria brevis]